MQFPDSPGGGSWGNKLEITFQVTCNFLFSHVKIFENLFIRVCEWSRN